MFKNLAAKTENHYLSPSWNAATSDSHPRSRPPGRSLFLIYRVHGPLSPVLAAFYLTCLLFTFLHHSWSGSSMRVRLGSVTFLCPGGHSTAQKNPSFYCWDMPTGVLQGSLTGLPMTVSWETWDFAAPESLWALQKYSPAWSRCRFLSTSLLSCL